MANSTQTKDESVNQEELPKEPTAQDLAAKHNRQQEEKAQAIKAIKATSRNTDCPCGCGNKAKKCPNGRRVLEFKKYMRGSVVWEVVMFLLIVLLVGSIYRMVTSEMRERVLMDKLKQADSLKTECNDVYLLGDTLYVDTVQSKP
jgi:hypothetical protein